MTQPTTPSKELVHWLDEQLSALALSGRSPPTLNALQTEASFRQFYRIDGAKNPLVLMDSPPDKEQNAQFVAVAKAFAASGIAVPEVLAHQETKGWLLLTDLGRTHFIDAYRLGKQHECIEAAINTLATLNSPDSPIDPTGLSKETSIPPYTQARLSDELNIFVDWLVTDACQMHIPEAVFEQARVTLLANAANQPQVCVHRDFHCKNLLFNGPGKPIGVLDFQDALMGPAGYDLASLLHDCYWKFPDAFIDKFVEVLPNTSRRAIDLLAVQRQLKAVGIFARLAIRDQKISHLPHIEPVLMNLCELCSRYQELAALGEWLATQLTPSAKTWVTKNASQRPLAPAQSQ